MHLGAIDIGSNAARLLISEVNKDGNGEVSFIKTNLVRIPLRLGFDVFETGEIPQQKINMILETMKAYKHLLNIYDIKYLKACATSAMRDAKNSGDIINKVEDETGIKIEIISGSA